MLIKCDRFAARHCPAAHATTGTLKAIPAAYIGILVRAFSAENDSAARQIVRIVYSGIPIFVPK